MNKRLIVAGFIALFLLGIYLSFSFQIKKFVDVTGISTEEVNRIYIFSGRTGESYSTVDKTQIKNFLLMMQQRSFRLRKDQWNITMGYSYYVDLYKNDERLTRVMFKGSTVIIDNFMYLIDKDVTIQVADFWNRISLK